MGSNLNGERPDGEKRVEGSTSFEKRAANGTVAVHTIAVSAEGKAADKKLDQHEM